ncbi:unnamed protein product [Diamesa tonsa]
MFAKFNVYLDSEQEIREKIREIMRQVDAESKEAISALQVIHVDISGVSKACQDARGVFAKCNLLYKKLDEVVPQGQYYRYFDHWNFITQRLVFLIALVIYLEAGFLVQRDTAAEILGSKYKSIIRSLLTNFILILVATKQQDGFFLDLETFLMGVLQMVSELSRFAINSVTLGDYSRVLSLQKFVADLNSGFRLLNLKNDNLRKRFDSLKYDVKKIEEIVYDLSIRGLIKPIHGEEAAQEDKPKIVVNPETD